MLTMKVSRIIRRLAMALAVLVTVLPLPAPAALSLPSLAGTWGFVAYAFNSSQVEPNAPAPGAALPTPLGFLSQSGTLTIDSAGNGTTSYSQNQDGTYTSGLTSSDSFTITPDGRLVTTNASGTHSHVGHVDVSGNLLFVAEFTPGRTPGLIVAGRIPAGTYSNASLNGTMYYEQYYHTNGYAQSLAPAVGAALPAPLGFGSIFGTGTFDGAGNMSVSCSYQLDEAAAAACPASSYTYAVGSNGSLDLYQGATHTQTGWLVDGNIALTAAASGQNAGILVGFPKAGTYSTSSLAGFFRLVAYYQDYTVTQAPMPATGTPLPQPLGLHGESPTLWFDGAGNLRLSSVKNKDGTTSAIPAQAGTYTVSSAGVVTLNIGSGAVNLTGHLLAGGTALALDPQAANNPELVVGIKTAPPAPLHDFNGDGQGDLLWTNTSGAAAVWEMSGTTPLSQTVFGPYTGWTLNSGDPDFNGDGMSDLVWTNTSGAVALWLMNGSTPTSQAIFGPYTGWTLLSANADFNGDGNTDLLWWNAGTGQASIWLMSGTTVLSQSVYGPYSGWMVVSGNNDFNGDGMSDLLWTNSSGQAAIWLMNGTTITSQAAFGPYSGWTVASGDADYNGDGHTDLLWTNSNGAASVWLMNGANVLSQATFGPYTGWSVVPGRRDFNGDFHSDLQWLGPGNASAVWLMNGTAVLAQGNFGPYSGWTPTSAALSCSGDGVNDLIWQNSNGQAALWLVNGVTELSATVFGPYSGWTVFPGNTLP